MFAPQKHAQILSTVLERGEASEVLSLVVTAAQCMREVAVDKKVVELRHPGQGEDKLTKTVSSRSKAVLLRCFLSLPPSLPPSLFLSPSSPVGQGCF